MCSMSADRRLLGRLSSSVNVRHHALASICLTGLYCALSGIALLPSEGNHAHGRSSPCSGKPDSETPSAMSRASSLPAEDNRPRPRTAIARARCSPREAQREVSYPCGVCSTCRWATGSLLWNMPASSILEHASLLVAANIHGQPVFPVCSQKDSFPHAYVCRSR